MAKAIEPIPVLRGKAAAWFEEFLKRGEKLSPERERQAREDKILASRIKPLQRDKKQRER